MRLIEESKSSGSLFQSARPTKRDITEQSHIIGHFYDFRNATVGERLKPPPATEAKIAAVAAKGEIVQSFSGTDAESDINVDDLIIPGVRIDDAEVNFQTIRQQDNLNKLLNGDFDENPKDDTGKTLEDEAAFFDSGVRALENTAAVLRLLEGRIHAYKRAIDKCRKTLVKLKQLLTRTDGRLKKIGDELAEARHDVSVSRTLKAEEQNRIDEINDRRDKILEEHVPFLVFYRPRLSEARDQPPARTLHPDLSEIPFPECIADVDEAPPELDAFIQVLRDAPMHWFRFSRGILAHLDRFADLIAALKFAKTRARSGGRQHIYFQQQINLADRYEAGIGRAIFLAKDVVLAQRRKTADVELERFGRIGWREAVTTAETVVSLGDVIDGNHGRSLASRFASQELDRMARMATCLYLRFGEVLPAIRLDWAERLSQFDAPINLRNLYSLPRWGEVDFIERNQIQRLVDWLYQRVDVNQTDAVALISNLVRVCILLASHAPVRKLISGRLPKPTVIRAGGKVSIDIDLSRVRVGMKVIMESAGKVVADGVIEDFVAGQASVHILKAPSEPLTLPTNTKVQVGAFRA